MTELTLDGIDTSLRLDPERSRDIVKQIVRKTGIRTERTLRMMAKEMAATWWDESTQLETRYLDEAQRAFARQRSAIFRLTWPDQKFYVQIAWPLFYKEARRQAIEMLGNPNISAKLKSDIYDAIVADREKNPGR